MASSAVNITTDQSDSMFKSGREAAEKKGVQVENRTTVLCEWIRKKETDATIKPNCILLCLVAHYVPT